MGSYTPRTAYGPWLRYQDWNLNSHAWTGSILVVSQGPQPPYLVVDHAGHQFTPRPVCLDNFQNYSFWRWQLDLQLLQQESTVTYTVTALWFPGQTSEKRNTFALPGQNQCWHWGFHSCNGFSHGVEASWELADTALWKDVLAVHAQMPMHCMVGGGDQLYQDGFFKEPALVQWLAIKDRQARERAPVTQDMDAQISHFMFHHYCNWFSKPHMADAFAQIPQVMTWDDHDLMDGYGSYPEALQNCPVFQHAYKVACRFYLLFQQHTALPQAHQQANLFGSGNSFSFLRLLGHGVALVAPDVRTERTRKQVVSPASWQLIFDKIDALPASVRHLVVLTTIPVVYPKIPLTEKAMGLLSNIGRDHAVDMLLTKTGLWGAVKGKVMSGFNEPELLDDLLDHWTSDFHSKEREMLIKRLQIVAQGRNIRVMFISGDVHVGGLGRLYSQPKVNLRNDFRFMPQVVSSAIMNAPPPAGVVSTLHTCSNAHMSGVDKHTKEKMVRLFKADYPKTEKLLAKRNWATLRELPPGAPPPTIPTAPKDVPLAPGDLLCVLRVEHDHKQPHLPVRQYHIPVPTLEPTAGAYGRPGSTYGATQPASCHSGMSSATASFNATAPALSSYSSTGVPGYTATLPGAQTGQAPLPAYSASSAQPPHQQQQWNYPHVQQQNPSAYPAAYSQPHGQSAQGQTYQPADPHGFQGAAPLNAQQPGGYGQYGGGQSQAVNQGYSQSQGSGYQAGGGHGYYSNPGDVTQQLGGMSLGGTQPPATGGQISGQYYPPPPQANPGSGYQY